jgi:hypothetical protein
MREYIDQIFEEGLGKKFYLFFKKRIDKRIKKQSTNNFFSKTIKVIYLLITIILCIIYIYFSWF